MMSLLRRSLVTLAMFALVFIGHTPARGQQPAQPGAGETTCGTVTCAAGCDCQLTKCDPQAQPGCVDVGVCVDCPGDSKVNQPVIAAAAAAALAVGVGLYLYLRRRRRPAP